MTNNGSSDQLDLKQVAALLQQSIVASNERMTRIEQSIGQVEQLTQSNGRAIQALTEDITTFKLAVEQDREESKAERQELRQATIGIANLLSSLDSDRPTILRKLSTIEKKIDRILEGDELPKSGSQIQGGDDLPA
jgi:chromosome segregation ATPase